MRENTLAEKEKNGKRDRNRTKKERKALIQLQYKSRYFTLPLKWKNTIFTYHHHLCGKAVFFSLSPSTCYKTSWGEGCFVTLKHVYTLIYNTHIHFLFVSPTRKPVILYTTLICLFTWPLMYIVINSITYAIIFKLHRHTNDLGGFRDSVDCVALRECKAFLISILCEEFPFILFES